MTGAGSWCCAAGHHFGPAADRAAEPVAPRTVRFAVEWHRPGELLPAGRAELADLAAALRAWRARLAEGAVARVLHCTWPRPGEVDRGPGSGDRYRRQDPPPGGWRRARWAGTEQELQPWTVATAAGWTMAGPAEVQP